MAIVKIKFPLGLDLTFCVDSYDIAGKFLVFTSFQFASLKPYTVWPPLIHLHVLLPFIHMAIYTHMHPWSMASRCPW